MGEIIIEVIDGSWVHVGKRFAAIKAGSARQAALRAAGHIRAGLHPANAFDTKCVGLSKAQVNGFRKIASTHLPGQRTGADRALRLAAQGAELEHFLMVRPLWQLAQTCWDEPCAWHMCECAWKVQMPIFTLQQAAFVKRGSKWSHWRPLCVPQVSTPFVRLAFRANAPLDAAGKGSGHEDDDITGLMAMDGRGGATGWSTVARAKDGSPRVLQNGKSAGGTASPGNYAPTRDEGAVPDASALAPLRQARSQRTRQCTEASAEGEDRAQRRSGPAMVCGGIFGTTRLVWERVY